MNSKDQRATGHDPVRVARAVRVFTVLAFVCGAGFWVWAVFLKERGAEPPAVAAEPDGYLYRWDPRVLDAAGNPTGEERELPAGWKLCDGTDGTIDLTGGGSAFRYITRAVPDAPLPSGASLPVASRSK